MVSGDGSGVVKLALVVEDWSKLPFDPFCRGALFKERIRCVVHPPFPFKVIRGVPQTKALLKAKMVCVGEEESLTKGLAPQIPSFFAGSVGFDTGLTGDDGGAATMPGCTGDSGTTGSADFRDKVNLQVEAAIPKGLQVVVFKACFYEGVH